MSIKINNEAINQEIERHRKDLKDTLKKEEVIAKELIDFFFKI